MTITTKQISLFALDPVHVGTGDAHLSHIDMQIVRDPADNLPKIPGSSLSGVIRNGAAYSWQRIPSAPSAPEAPAKRLCAGAGTKKQPHCGACPVCHLFGTSLETHEKKGALSFHDALLLLFPLYSCSHGPMWICSHSRAQEFYSQRVTRCLTDRHKVYTNFLATRLILGRHLLAGDELSQITLNLEQGGEREKMLAQKIAFIPDTLFSRLVNENLEVRTSVSINPFTGAAESSALFTYEAIPRAALLVAPLIIDESRYPAKGKSDWPEPWKLVEDGLNHLRLTGIGGMNSRGFGRVKAVLEEI